MYTVLGGDARDATGKIRLHSFPGDLDDNRVSSGLDFSRFREFY